VIAGVNRDDGFLDITVGAFTGELHADLNVGKFTIVGSYMDTDNKSRSYGPGFLFQQDDTAKQNSLEARLAGESDRLRRARRISRSPATTRIPST
jgi:hypothetical protein